MSENPGIYIKNMALMKRKYKAPGKNGVVNAGKFSYKYATLDDIINAIDKATSDAGVLLIHDQSVKYENGFVYVRTTIKATTDDMETYWIEDFGWFAIPANAQVKEIGGAETYARRYAISAAYGIATEEDKDAIGLEVTHKAPNSSQNNNQGNYAKPSNNRSNVQNKPEMNDKEIEAQYDKKFAEIKTEFGETDESMYKILGDSYQINNRNDFVARKTNDKLGIVRWLEEMTKQ